MKCFSLISQWRFMAVASPATMSGSHGVYAHRDGYPQAQAGIRLAKDDRNLVVGWQERIAPSPKLLSLSADDGAIQRGGSDVVVIRASLDEPIEGRGFQLVPERSGEQPAALVLVDIGSGPYLNVRYQANGAKVISHVKVDHGWGCYEEKLLVVVKPFEPVTAIRSSKKYWLFGPQVVREVLSIKFDGQNIFYDVKSH